MIDEQRHGLRYSSRSGPTEPRLFGSGHRSQQTQQRAKERSQIRIQKFPDHVFLNRDRQGARKLPSRDYLAPAHRSQQTQQRAKERSKQNNEPSFP
jgi:hypothetical protein